MSNNQTSEFIMIDWDVGDFCYKFIDEDCVICSPDFYIGEESTTKWKLMLRPKAKRNEDIVFSINLKRLYNESSPATVSVASKVFIANKNRTQSFATYHEGSFMLTSCEISFYLANYILNHLGVNELEPANFKIFCSLVVKNTNSSQSTHGPSDTGLRSLSRDLTNLWESSADSDLAIKTESGMEIRCHKAILNARNPTFVNFLKDKKYTLTLGKLDCEVLKHIFTYIYSGNIDEIARNASPKLYECLLFMKMKNTEDYLSSRWTFLLSHIDMKKYQFTWVIGDPSLLCYRGEMTVNYLYSEHFQLSFIDSTWRLTLHLNDLNNSRRYVSISADMLSGSVPEKCCVTFVLRSEKDVWARSSTAIVDGKKHMSVFEFIPRESFERKIKSCSNLQVDFVVLMHSNDFRFSISEIVYDRSFPKDHFYDCLSDDLALAFERADNADTTVEVEGGFDSIRVHKCILTARSHALSSRIVVKDGKFVIDLQHMKRSVVQAVLRYVYSGRLENCEERDFPDVYRTAELFELTELKEKCSDKMRQLITVDTACAPLVLASQEKDQKLEKNR